MLVAVKEVIGGVEGPYLPIWFGRITHSGGIGSVCRDQRMKKWHMKNLIYIRVIKVGKKISRQTREMAQKKAQTRIFFWDLLG